MKDYQAHIAAKARELRQAKGWTQTKVTVATGIAPTTVSNIEKCGKPFSLNTAYLYAHVFEVPMHVFFPEQSEDVVAELMEAREV